MTKPQRVLCIGLDGATFDVLSPWMDDGTLPNLANLKRTGTWGELASTVPPLTAPAWISFMTGQSPGSHGVFHFLDLSDDRARARGERRLTDLSQMKSPAIWDVLAHQERRVGLINIPMTYPPRPVNGFMISGMMTPPDAPYTWPPDLTADLGPYKIDIDEFSSKRPFARDMDDGPGVADVDGLIDSYHRLMLERSDTAHRFLVREAWDFFMVVYTGTDRLGHYAWPYHRQPTNGNRSDHTERRYRAVRSYYRELDEQIGRLVEAAGPDAVTVIMSDHGMGPTWTRRVHLNEWLYRRGLLKLVAKNGRSANPDEWMMRFGIPRDRLARLVRALPIPKRAVKRAAASGGSQIDFNASQAYYVHIYNHVGGIRVNATTPDEAAAIAEDLTREIPQLIDEETGRPIFRRVVHREDVFEGRHTESMPDLITIAEPDFAVNTRVSHRSRLVTERHEVEIPGAHRDEGVFLASGPGILPQAEPLEGVRIEDVAPTLLHLLGSPVPEAMTGRVVTEALDPALFDGVPVSPLPGNGLGIWHGDGVDMESREHQEADDERLLEHLKALGYL